MRSISFPGVRDSSIQCCGCATKIALGLFQPALLEPQPTDVGQADQRVESFGAYIFTLRLLYFQVDLLGLTVLCLLNVDLRQSAHVGPGLTVGVAGSAPF